jgi:hypothetical protein
MSRRFFTNGSGHALNSALRVDEKSKIRRNSAKRRRATLESLEARLLLSTADKWVNASGGDWDTAANWSAGVPVVGQTAVINIAVSAPITKTANSVDTFDSLTSSQPIVLSGGTLDIKGVATTSSTFTLNGGGLSDAILGTTGAGSVVLSSNRDVSLSGVTLATNLTIPTHAYIYNGLTLSNATITLAANSTTPAQLAFINQGVSQSLNGSGSIVFAGSSPNNSIVVQNFTAIAAPLTIAANIQIHGASGSIELGNSNSTALVSLGTISSDVSGQAITIDGSGGLDNEGTLSALNGGTLTLNSSWVNNGTITQTGSTLNLRGSITPTSLGKIIRSGGVINLNGQYDAGGGTLAFNASTGSWNLIGGEGAVLHATITTADGAGLIPTSSGGMLVDVTLAGNMTLAPAAQFRVFQNLTLSNGMLTIDADSTGVGSILFDADGGTGYDQEIKGTGQIVFNGTTSSSASLYVYDDSPGVTSTLTIGSGVEIHGGGGNIVLTPNQFVTLINQGTISADVAGQAIAITGNGNFDNQGIVEAAPGTIQFGTDINAGTGTFSVGIGGSTPGISYGQITVNGSLTLGGTLHATLLNGFIPAANQAFTALTYTSDTGSFAAQTLTPPGATFTAAINATSTILTSHPGLLAPVITTTPQSQTIPAGNAATFSAAATSNPTATVRWQVSTNGGATFTNIAGATSTTYSFSTTPSQNGNLYRAIFTNSQGSATTAAATLTVSAALAAPVVTLNPTSQNVLPGGTVTFSAAATGNPSPTVSWQVSTDGGVTFNDLGIPTSGSTSLSFTTDASQNGYKYRAVFTNSQGTATTAAATLTVPQALQAPVITVGPSDQTVKAGDTVTFSIAVTGNPAPSVDWQVSTDGGKTFSSDQISQSKTLTLTATTFFDQYKFRAVVSNSVGSATSAIVTLTVDSPPVVGSPTNQKVSAGNTATFIASATGNPLPTVQWQLSTNGGANFNDIAGATSTTYAFTASASQDGNQYRAVFTNSVGSATTNAALLTIDSTTPAVVITKNPVSQTLPIGATCTFTAAATANPTPTIQWQVSNDLGNSFTNIVGATSTTYSFTVVGTQDRSQFRAIFNNSQVYATTAATLTISPAPAKPTITQNPISQSVAEGATAVFTAAATGNPAPTVVWEVSTNGGLTFNITGVKSPTYSFTAAASQNGYQYQAVFINSQGTATTTPATLNVVAASSSTIFPVNSAPAANQQNVNDPSITATGGVELGLKFSSDVAGTVDGVRFFKGTQNISTHTAELWSGAGQLLETASFIVESASGWQQVNFPTPVTIAANTTYVVSYQTSAPFISYTAGGLAASVDNAPLHALASGVSGGNSVFSYDTTPHMAIFPNHTNSQSPNYWIDVAFTPSTATPSASSVFAASSAPAANSQNVNDSGITANGGVELGAKFTSDVSGSVTGIRFFKGSLDTGTQSGELWNSAGTLLATATFTGETASGWQQVNFSNPVAIQANTTYIISYHSTSPYLAYTAGGLASQINNGPLHLLAGSATYKYGSVGVPTSSNGQSPNYWVDVVFNGGTTTRPPNVLGNSAPATQNVNDPGITSNGGVELGAKFSSDVAGTITGIRFFKGSLDTGTQTGELWSSAGTLLATATFTNETASGWQQVLFSIPVTIQANTIYTISYHTTAPYIAYTSQGLATTISNGPLHLLAGGVYKYGSSGLPTLSNEQSPNYWVDVMFQ